jgi:hypothetical protein
MIEVTCMCGWQCRGPEEDVIAQVQAHGTDAHGVSASRDAILAIAIQVPA